MVIILGALILILLSLILVYYVRVYNKLLSAAEVLQNYNAQKSRFGL